MATQLKYGSYIMLGTFYPKTVDRSSRATVVDLPRTDGGVALPQKRKAGRISIEGGFHQNEAGAVDLKTTLDNLYAALDAGPANLQLDSDRYWRNALKTMATDSYDPSGYNDFVSIRIDFDLPDPYQYAGSGALSQTWNSPISGGTVAVNNSAGNAYAWPVITVTLSAIAALNATITNQTTAEAFTLSGAPGASSVVVNGLSPRTVQSGGVDSMSLFEGQFPTLLPGNNTFGLTLNAGNAATISSIGFSWVPRWS